MREQFERAIQEDPLSESTKHIFADWLDEQGEHEEAAHYRSWSLEAYLESEAWLRNFASRLTPWSTYGKYYEEGSPEPDDDYHRPRLTYEELLEAADEHMKTGGSTAYLNFDTPDFVWAEAKEFWQHYKTVRHLRELQEGYREVFFRCGC